MTHTPGPWRIDAGDELYIVGHPDKKCTRYGIEGEWEVATITGLHEDDKAQMMANARLIAAAPDLLEALQRLERTVRILPPGMDQPDSPLAQARAAILKATHKPQEE